MIVIIIIVNAITKKQQKWQRTTERAKFEIKVKWQSVKWQSVKWQSVKWQSVKFNLLILYILIVKSV